MADLFVEIFPVTLGAVPRLNAFVPIFAQDATYTEEEIEQIGSVLASRLRRSQPGAWFWDEARLITDTSTDTVELAITLELLKAEEPERFSTIDLLVADRGDWQPAPLTQARYTQSFRLREIAGDMQAALDQMVTRIRNATVERRFRLQPWVVHGQPAISISITSQLIYNQDVQIYAGASSDRSEISTRIEGLAVLNTIDNRRGRIIDAAGTVDEFRDTLLKATDDPLLQDIINHAPGDEWVIRVQFGNDEILVLATALRLIVQLSQLHRFDVEHRQAVQALQMQPAVRARHVRAVSDVAKAAGLLSNAYNARDLSNVFSVPEDEIDLRFGSNRIRAYNPPTLRYDFTHCGLYRLRPAFESNPIRVCVINTLTFKVEDFVEALHRYLERHFDFLIDVVRERQVRVLSRSNLESAVRVVEKESPDLILAFFPDALDASSDDDVDHEANAAIIRSLTLGRGLPTHIIFESTLNDPEAMPAIVMSILGKTGSAPFVLTEPIPETDFVIGLDVVREARTGESRFTAITRVYRADGDFVRFRLRDVTVPDEALPYVLVRDLFPQKEYSGKRVLIHHDGQLPPDLLAALTRWSQAIGATFMPVEIDRAGAPRLYAIDRAVVRPPWGSVFKFSDTEALLVSSVPRQEISPQPLHVRTVSAGSPALRIDRALRSVLVWTLLAYGAEQLPNLPVTVLNADQVAYWLRKGGSFGSDEGEVPFWL